MFIILNAISSLLSIEPAKDVASVVFFTTSGSCFLAPVLKDGFRSTFELEFYEAESVSILQSLYTYARKYYILDWWRKILLKILRCVWKKTMRNLLPDS